MSAPARPYLSNGQVLQSAPLSTRVRGFFSDSYNFAGLYLTTLFTLDATAAAESSPYNTRNRNQPRTGGSRYGGGGGSSGGGGGGPSGGKRVGRVDDIRGPECKSCQ